MTTRIRINIPGSRPIPPVVMRTPMSDTDAGTRPPASGGPASGGPPAPGGSESERTGGVPRPAAPAEGDGRPQAPAAEEKPAASDWFAPRKAAAPGPAPAPTPPPAAAPPQQGRPGGPGPGPGGPAGQGGPAAGGFAPGGAQQTSGLSALVDETPAAGLPTRPPGGGPDRSRQGDGFAPGPRTPPTGVRPPGPDRGPAGPTSGPVTGDMPLGPGPGGQAGPPRMSDDTAVLTPQKPAPEPVGGHVSGDTLTSGIPVVPSDGRSPFAPGGPARSGPPGGPGADQADPAFPGGPGAGPTAAVPAPDPAPRPAAPPRARKGRSKLVLAGVGAFGLLAVAYGAGLLLNHSDVPKSTTVLGVDIGGGTRDEAVNKLEAAFGKRAAAPLQLAVGGQKAELAPDKAGLSLDSQATVRGAAGSDYNPVSVIGSLFGGERVAQPVIVVDEEKLGVALSDLAGTAGSASDGTIRFEPGKAVAVPGKPGESLDVARSMVTVKDAYRAQVETGKPNVVTLPVATREPTISQAEIDRAMKEFAEPAMSGLITIRAGGKEIQFGPAKSLPKILSMKPVDGKLVEYYDKAAIEQLLDGVFDGIMITKGDGKQHEVSADDVAQAMGPALRGKTPAERTAVIPLDPS
ncbi:hypothetical protein EAO77_12060 [Streptomyces sp. t39]|nr:hypothetical protein EAO77_12060 [Streptomyces sp. t39]